MKWTAEQKKAIDTDNRNILVSAAAGSGKTTVLIERIGRLIIEEEVDVDRFLITTFTNAAAAEMKERLEKEITERIDKDDDKKQFLRKQLTLLPDAHIETFHSFSIGIIRDYFFLTDLQPGFSIGDETRINLMKQEVIGSVFEDRFENDGERFKAFLRSYSNERNDYRLKETILDIYKEMLSLPDYMEWAEEKVGKLDEVSPVVALGIDRFIRTDAAIRLKEASVLYSRAADILNKPETESIYLKARQDAEEIKALASELGNKDGRELSLEDIKDMIDGIKLNSMRAYGDEKVPFDMVKEEVSAIRKQGKSIIDKVKKSYLAQPADLADETIRSLYPDTRYFLGIIWDLDRALKERKLEENIIDFDDAMHYAIEILKDEKAAEDYKNRFKYIFIDEYQDSNYLQENIVRRIASDNNLFMVGDIKQSIYKFRLAEPEIFRDKYREYLREEEENSIKIDLNNNFRSKGNIRTFVNTLFAQVMDGYDESAALVGPEGGGPAGPPVELHIISNDAEESEGEEEKEEKTAFTEGALVAEIIRKYIGSEYTDKRGEKKTMRYGDIAVLSRGGAAVSQIERYLNNEDIPAYGETAGGYYETIEIRIFMDLLKVICNIKQDVPLISVMSAMFFDFTPMELARIRIQGKDCKYYSDALMEYGEKGEDPQLKAKIRDMTEKISLWREMSRTMPLDELMEMLIYETGYYDYCSSLPVGHRRISNLRLLIERAAAYEETSYMGLYGFLSYVDAMKKSSQKVNEAPIAGEGEDAVRVMTVHKSKGLEFPMVIMVGTGKQIKGKSSGYNPAMHKDFSIGLPLINKDMHTRSKTLLQQVISGKKKFDEIEEEIRILYVALTRPMDRLVMIGSVGDMDKLTDTPSKGSFIEMIYPAMLKMTEEEGDVVRIRIHNSKTAFDDQEPDDFGEAGPMDPFHQEASDGTDGTDDGLYKEIDRRLSYSYPNETALSVKPKYSVSMLAGGYDEEEEGEGFGLPLEKTRSTEVRKMEKEEEALTPAQRGTVMHDIMERLDFSRAEAEGSGYVKTFIEELKEKEILTDLQFEAAYNDEAIGNIAAFFDDPIGKRAAAAESLKKENEFIMEQTIEGEAVVVQGKIDCWFEEDDGLVLIDYKNNKIGRYADENKIIEEYKSQIRLYREALEKATGKPVKEAWLYMFRERKFLFIS